MAPLPPHPNIVAMHCVFADWIPHIPGALTDYPDALPSRINPHGSGRNMSLFLLMKRFVTRTSQSFILSSNSHRKGITSQVNFTSS